jgi:hypothetical protein
MLLVLNFYSLTVLPIDCGPANLKQAIFSLTSPRCGLSSLQAGKGENLFRYSRQYNKIQPTRRRTSPLVKQLPRVSPSPKTGWEEDAVCTCPHTKLLHLPYVQAQEFHLETLCWGTL